jgi:hypothetical protein
MPGFPKYQGKVWKWDFKSQAVDPSGTRKGWRLLAFVPDPTASGTILARSFFCYPKKNEPGGNPATRIAKELKCFLRDVVDTVDTGEERFRRQPLSNGQICSLCYSCCETVFVSEIEAEIEMAERSHVCAAKIPQL